MCSSYVKYFLLKKLCYNVIPNELMHYINELYYNSLINSNTIVYDRKSITIIKNEKLYVCDENNGGQLVFEDNARKFEQIEIENVVSVKCIGGRTIILTAKMIN